MVGFGNKAVRGVRSSVICHDKEFRLELRRSERAQEEGPQRQKSISLIVYVGTKISHTFSMK